MNFSTGLNIVYGNDSTRSDVKSAEAFMNEIPILARQDIGGTSLEVKITGNNVTLDPRAGGKVSYEGIEKLELNKYSINLALSDAEHGKRHALFIVEKEGQKRSLSLYTNPANDESE